MKLFEIDSVSSHGNTPIEIDDAIQLIKENCKQFLTVAKLSKRVLYRGIKGDLSYTAFIGVPPVDRKSLSTSNRMQTYIDKALRERGFANYRSNSIFCTANPKLAEDFGKLFLVFPYDGYTFMWSPTHEDIVIPDLFMQDKQLSKDTAHNPLLSTVIPYARKIGDQAAKNFDDTTGQYSKLIEMARSIMRLNDIDYSKFDIFDVEAYATAEFKYGEVTDQQVIDLFKNLVDFYLILIKKNIINNIFTPDQWKHIKNIINNKIKITKNPATIIDGIIKQYDFQTTNLGTAMKSGHEIAIHSKYVALKFTNELLPNLHALGLTSKY